MAEQIYNESTFRFTDPVRLFKANDPYYFEVDNIPLKQLQENCLWLKDQIRRDVIKISNVKRADIEELRPYASGGDRIVRVKPGRFTARINDASTKTPLAYLRKILGGEVGEVDVYEAALPNPGTFQAEAYGAANARLIAALDTFKDKLAEDSLGLNGLGERSFTWPIVRPELVIPRNGVTVSTQSDSGALGYNPDGAGVAARAVPMIITEALVWAKSRNSSADKVTLTTYDYTDPFNGFALLPKTESFFVRAWRGVARNAIVDIPEELTIEVPNFSNDDFNYIDESGNEASVGNVYNRIDMVFIYSKPIDASSTTVLRSSGKEVITRPTLGIVRGAGIKANFLDTPNYENEYIEGTGEDHMIMASPGDTENENLGFIAASGNDIAYDVRGSFPAPDDLLNIAPLISEQLESDAFELIGQSILPVAYVWVTRGSSVVSTTDVIDIRPLFRTAELAYNERTGIAAAMPQLSLANPAVGKAQMDYEMQRQYNEVNSRLNNLEVVEETGLPQGMRTVAAGYVFGGWNFGPEGAMYDFYRQVFSQDVNPDNDSEAAIKDYVRQKYGLSRTGFDVPAYPDWDVADWARLNSDLTEVGRFPNDYINTFFSQYGEIENENQADGNIVAGAAKEFVGPDGLNSGGNPPSRQIQFNNASPPNARSTGNLDLIHFSYVKKRIEFDRESYPGMIDYTVDINFVNSIPQISGAKGSGDGQVLGFNLENSSEESARYIGNWVEKGEDYFIIYIAFATHDLGGNNRRRGPGLPITSNPLVPAPHTYKPSGQNTVTASERGGERFSAFAVPVDDILTSNPNPQRTTSPLTFNGYLGNPRIGKCTYPTVTWSMKAVSQSDASFFYGNLNTNNVISLNQD
ncbi:MAG: hypothetical protein CMJ25_27130 [Phycisphaerae bacterium]|nr:hypothetical protein [Phycisphaerae bacterium]